MQCCVSKDFASLTPDSSHRLLGGPVPSKNIPKQKQVGSEIRIPGKERNAPCLRNGSTQYCLYKYGNTDLSKVHVRNKNLDGNSYNSLVNTLEC